MAYVIVRILMITYCLGCSYYKNNEHTYMWEQKVAHKYRWWNERTPNGTECVTCAYICMYIVCLGTNRNHLGSADSQYRDTVMLTSYDDMYLYRNQHCGVEIQMSFEVWITRIKYKIWYHTPSEPIATENCQPTCRSWYGDSSFLGITDFISE